MGKSKEKKQRKKPKKNTEEYSTKGFSRDFLKEIPKDKHPKIIKIRLPINGHFPLGRDETIDDMFILNFAMDDKRQREFVPKYIA